MTPTQLYDLLEKAGVEYEIVEIFEGVRILSIEVDDNKEEESND
jgi:hypothetical protein